MRRADRQSRRRRLAEAARASAPSARWSPTRRLLEPLRDALAGSGIEAAAGGEAVLEAAGAGADWTMAAIVGCAGLRPTMAAIERRPDRRARQQGGAGLGRRRDDRGRGQQRRDAAAGRFRAQRDLPVPRPATAGDVRRITLTASGGPFRDRSLEQMRAATPGAGGRAPQLGHGRQDHRRFRDHDEQGARADRGLPPVPGRARRVRHRRPPAIGDPLPGRISRRLDARPARPARHARADRLSARLARADGHAVRAARPRRDRRADFRRARSGALSRARPRPAGVRDGGASPAVLNAANEVAVAAFLAGRIGFPDIAAIAAETLQCYAPPAPASLDEVLDVDREARAARRAIVKRVIALTDSPGILWTILGFLLVLGPLVFVHELGHYLVGRWFGVKAEAFSVGFGKELAGWTDRRGTRWKLGGCRSAAMSSSPAT